jgi:hypothetical protein
MSIATITYTGLVPADIDADEIGIAEARSNLTELVAQVRLLKRVKFLTNRSRRMAALVPVEVGELVEEFGGPDALVEFVRHSKNEA